MAFVCKSIKESRVHGIGRSALFEWKFHYKVEQRVSIIKIY